MILFDSSIVKVQADGDTVLSNYLEDGEVLAPGSFAQPVVPETLPEF